MLGDLWCLGACSKLQRLKSSSKADLRRFRSRRKISSKTQQLASLQRTSDPKLSPATLGISPMEDGCAAAVETWPCGRWQEHLKQALFLARTAYWHPATCALLQALAMMSNRSEVELSRRKKFEDGVQPSAFGARDGKLSLISRSGEEL